MQVTKRDGTLQPYDVSKIKKCIDWATNKIDVNPLELEANLSVQLTEGVKTSDIHASCIDEALKLCTPDEPNWRYVAGRLLYMDWLKKVSQKRQLENPYSYNFFSNLKDKVANNVYDSKLLDLYTELEIETVSSYLVPERDLDYDYAGAFTLIKRYLIDNELPQEMYLVLAMFLAGRETDPKTKLDLVKRIYDAISLRKISLATPLLMNLRKPQGNLSSCFILSIDDNIHSIFDGVKDAALISKNGGGVGCVDGETEYLTEEGWKKISEYDPEKPCKIAQYIPDTDSISFVFPEDYIKVPCTEINYLKTKYGLSQKICDNHRVLYYSEESKKQQKPLEAFKIIEKTNQKKGFRGLIKCSFSSVSSEGLNYSDLDLRLITAIQADGSFTSEGTNRCVMEFKKERKCKRLENLLEALNLDYKKVEAPTGHTWYTFYSPYKIKHFPSEFYTLNKSQLKVIAEESVYWDGCQVNGNLFSTTTESDADFIQYCWVAQNKRASKVKYVREDGKYEFRVRPVDNAFCGLRFDPRVGHNPFLKVPTSDGYKYCFSVPSGALLLRHHDCIFITHNCNVSKIRAEGSSIKGKKNASGGVIPFIKILNDTALAVDQGGKRAGAFTIGLDIWHLDIENFLRMQVEEGDSRKKAFDIFPQVIVPDFFMHMKQKGEDWLLVDPYEVKQKFGCDLTESWGDTFISNYLNVWQRAEELDNFKFVKANDLWKVILRTQTETGLPYLFFKDTANKFNPNQGSGYIPQANLCCESFSNTSPDSYTHCCNLVSINLANVLEESEEREIANTAVIILENAVELTEPPIPEAKAHNEYYRTIGVGFMGLADWLAYHNKNYYTGKDFAKSMFERYAKYCIASSIELAKKYGTFGAFESSEWAKGNLLGRPLEWFLENTDAPTDWLELSQQVQMWGIRHSQLLAIAPNTNTSLLQGCTASILPPYNSFFYDSNGKGKYPIVPPYYDTKKWYYNENINMEQKVVVDFIADAITPFIDSGISMELNFNTNNPQNTPKYISETLQLAWQKGCKTVYYVRSVTQKDEEQCIMCAN